MFYLTLVEFSDDHLSQRSMAEVFYLWKLAGGDVEAVLRKAGLAKTKVPVHLLPWSVTGMFDLVLKSVRLVPIGTNSVLFQISSVSQNLLKLI